MVTQVKTCGLRTTVDIDAALDAGAALVGFVFFPASPRYVSIDEAGPLFDHVRGAGKGRVKTVALTVDPSVDQVQTLMDALSPDLIQFHGSESPVTIATIRAATGCRAMKVIGVASAADLDAVPSYATLCDMMLLDAKAPKSATRPGGLGEQFDWSLLAGFDPGVPWLLAGGLDADNVGAALAQTGAPGVDVSTGIETAPGKKDPQRIARFIEAVRAADRMKVA